MTKPITQETLTGFRAWLLRRGRADETARVYCLNVNKCAQTSHLTDRLIDKKLSPKTRHSNLASLAAWAKYTKDGELVAELDEIKLPPAVRSKPKAELEIDAWRDVLVALGDERVKMPEACRNVLLILSTRGLRVGDVLRLTREEVKGAIATGTLAYEAKGGRRLEYDAETILPYLKALAGMKDWEIVRDLIGDRDRSDRSINKKLATALRKAARRRKVKGVHPHRMRRTYATHYAERLGNDPRALIKLTKHMGWTNINTAAGYIDNVNATELDQLGKDLVADVMRKKK